MNRTVSRMLCAAMFAALCSGGITQGAPVGTAFTYQGRLLDGNDVADGFYDFQFRLYDANIAGSQVGPTVNVPDVDVVDGYFTAELDFGSGVFAGQARWLETRVRPGELAEPNVYTTLSPRQAVSPAPYALYALNGVGDITAVNAGAGLTGGGTSGDVTLSVAAPLNLTSSGTAGTLFGTNTASEGRGVHGYASSITIYTNYGGYFEAAGTTGRGVYGKAGAPYGDINYGGYFEAAGGPGRGVCGYASNSGNYTNYGGLFVAAGTTGIGVSAQAFGASGTGVYGSGAAKGGDFLTVSGVGVSGYASSFSGTNYGGVFTAAGTTGYGVYAHASGSSGKGVVGYGQAYDFYAIGPGVDYGYGSSIRWKRDVEPIDEPLEKLMRLRGVYFNWDEEHGGRHDVGMIAEEVGEVLPEIVVYEPNSIYCSGMDYSKTTPLLVEAIKALKTENDELRQRVAALEAAVGQTAAIIERNEK